MLDEDVRVLKARLRSFSHGARTRVTRSSLNAGAGVVRKKARMLAPRRSGQLRKSITSRVSQTRTERQQGIVRAVVGFKRGTPGGRIGHLQELGTVNHAAQPFLRPAAENHREEIAAAIRKKADQAIDREIAKARGVRR